MGRIKGDYSDFHIQTDKKVGDEFKANCKRLGHKHNLVVEVLMEKFNANQRTYKSLIKKYAEKEKDGTG